MLEVICGGMYAGKSELLIHRLKRASYAKKNIIAFKPAIDDRYSVQDIASHSGYTFKSIARSISSLSLLSSSSTLPASSSTRSTFSAGTSM